MQTLKSKKLMLFLISLAAVFAFAVTASLAQEKIKISGKRVGTSKSDPIKVDDIEGHILSTGVSKGVDVVNNSIFIFWSTADLVKGNGTHQGYSKGVEKDGDVYFATFKGRVSTTMSPQGRPLVTFEGTWSLYKGTGKWENAQGGGTYKGRYIGPGIFTYDWQGEYFIKK